jgi:hypothetical protein
MVVVHLGAAAGQRHEGVFQARLLDAQLLGAHVTARQGSRDGAQHLARSRHHDAIAVALEIRHFGQREQDPLVEARGRPEAHADAVQPLGQRGGRRSPRLARRRSALP